MNNKKMLVSMLSLLAMIAIVFIGCSNDDEVTPMPESVVPVICNESISVFFEQYLPKDGHSEVFFTDVPENEETCMVIDNKDELRSAYNGDKELPEIDFSKYSLVIGKLYVAAGLYVKEQAMQYDSPTTLSIFLETDERGYIAIMMDIYYWGVYPKLPSKNLIIRKYYHGKERID